MSVDHDNFSGGIEPNIPLDAKAPNEGGPASNGAARPNDMPQTNCKSHPSSSRLRFTVFEAHGARLSKEYKLLDGGSVDIDGGTQLVNGSYHVKQFETAAGVPAALAEIGRLFEGLPPYAAIVLGVPRDGSTAGEIVTKARYAKGATDALTRTLEHFGWPDGPGLLLFDGDGIDGLRDALMRTVPAAGGRRVFDNGRPHRPL